MDQIQMKLDQVLQIDNIKSSIDESTLNTVQMVQNMIKDPKKHDILLQQKNSITEFLDNFLAVQTQKFQNFIPQPTAISPTKNPSDSQHLVSSNPLSRDIFIPNTNDPNELREALSNAYNASLELQKLAEYRASLNRQARQILEKSELEGAALREVIRFLLGGKAATVLEACAGGRSGVEVLERFFDAQNVDRLSINELAEAPLVDSTTFISCQKGSKLRANSSSLRRKALSASRESEYQKLLKRVNLK
ncbi:hypothetical protein SS50377_27536 [Spironucleus salmonicida]|uniref:Uncharacterized protein n=1 Tax=Spironucleus salmonicida TaxID=348837 RepID=V6LQC7_9EUKA|nr:hypothetical protein SS50377_27536 [Spironucleus salmonicida]|eukprot:EST46872.1 Hypothetical protein SS50377_13023 [Spironucleus salmonicida]